MTYERAGSPSAIDKATRFWESRTLLGLLVAAGAVLRIRQYAANPSFFAEEASLALNVVHRRWSELLLPLDYAQGAPPLFLWLARLLAVTCGHSEYVLRLVPVLASSLALPLFAASARTLVGKAAAPVAVGLLAFCDPLIGYATVFKQYSSDVAVSAGLLYLASRRRPLPLTAGGVVGMWLAHPAPILLTGVAATLIVDAAQPAAARQRRAAAAVLLAWLASALVLYVTHVRRVADNEVFKSYWAFAYAPFPPHAVQDWRWYPNSFTDLLKQAGLWWQASLVLIAGIVALAASRRWSVLLLSLVPLLAAYALSAAKAYPFGDRLILFLVPGVALLVGAGAPVPAVLLRRLFPLRRGFAGSLAGAVLIALQIAVVPVLFAASIPASIQLWRHPYRRSDLREMTQRLREQRRPGDLAFAGIRAWAPYAYYNLADAQAPTCLSGRPSLLLRGIREQRAKRVWLLFLTGSEKTEAERLAVLGRMDLRWHCDQRWHRRSSWLYLYRIDEGAADGEQRVTR